MFGIIYTLFGACVRGVAKFGGMVNDSNQQMKAKQLNQDTYFDSYGKERWVANGHRVYYAKNDNGDRCYFDATNGQVLRNIDEEHRERKKNEYLSKGIVFVHPRYRDLSKAESKMIDNHYIPLINVHRNLNNNKLYVKIHINGHMFYKNCETGLVESFEPQYINLIHTFNAHQTKLKAESKNDYFDTLSIYGYTLYFIDENNNVEGRE